MATQMIDWNPEEQSMDTDWAQKMSKAGLNHIWAEGHET